MIVRDAHCHFFSPNLFRTLVAKGHGELDGIAVLKLYDGKEHL